MRISFLLYLTRYKYTNTGDTRLTMMKSTSVVEKKDPSRHVCNWLGKCATYLLAPEDPSNLGVFRIAFGILMIIDIPQERGMSSIFNNWEPDKCHFPVFHFLLPASVEWMHVFYVIMLVGAIGIVLGLFYRLSCVLFMIPYWYIFLLDKAIWNNHSYLYGLVSIMLLLTDCNRYWSLDGFRNPKIRNAHIPKWNYVLFRFQIFLVYFYAGIKKLDRDWMSGYSMTGLSNKWVFDPFRPFLSDQAIDLFLVHISGLCYDLFVGFFLIFERTRLIGILFSLAFHGMNSQMFSIGMFSYTMMASLTLFCSYNWPKKLLCRLPPWLHFATPLLGQATPSDKCVYSSVADEDKHYSHKPEKEKNTLGKASPKPHEVKMSHKILLALFGCYVGIQCFLPYSHFITKGYNGWTEGLYGYSWDMMVHSWSTQHVRIKVVDEVTGNNVFIRPGAFIGGGRRRHSRWNSHPDMIKQYITCLAQKIKDREELNITKPAIYLDVWRSLNRRFQQRFLDPNIDVVNAPWSPFTQTPWVLPLLTELSPWREKLEAIEKQQLNTSVGNFTDIVFVADFPGLKLENFVSEELNTSITVLHGTVKIEINNDTYTLGKDDEMNLPANDTHVVYTVSETPACWMYVYLNTTLMKNETLREWITDPETRPSAKRKEEWNRKSMPEKAREFVYEKYMVFSVTFWNSYYAIGHLAFGMEYPSEEDEDVETDESSESQDSHSTSPSDGDGGVESGDDAHQPETNIPYESPHEDKETLPNTKKEL